MMTPEQQALNIAAGIVKDHWGTGHWVSTAGGSARQEDIAKGVKYMQDGEHVTFCALGAIGAAVEIMAQQDPNIDRKSLRRRVANKFRGWLRRNSEHTSVTSWNDHYTDKDGVVKFLTQAAEEIE